MKSFYILQLALDYMEQNIDQPLRLDDVAKACHFSLSGLHQLFRYAFHYSLREYIQKRRLSLACRDLVCTGQGILDIALKYQYGSHEAFTHAFVRLYGEAPQQYRRSHRYIDLFPKLKLNCEGSDMRKVDIASLYDEIKGLAGSYVLCADIKRFKEVNDTYGRAAGDIVLVKTAQRIEKLLQEDQLMFRIGRDEFAVITALYDKGEAAALATKILALNGGAMEADGKQIPVSLRVAAARIPQQGFDYGELIERLQSAIERSRGEGTAGLWIEE